MPWSYDDDNDDNGDDDDDNDDDDLAVEMGVIFCYSNEMKE